MNTKKILAIFAILTASFIQAQTYVKLKSIEPAPGSGYSIGTGTNGSPVYTKSLSITTLTATGAVLTSTVSANLFSASTGSIGSLSSSTITSGGLTVGTTSLNATAFGSARFSQGTAFVDIGERTTNEGTIWLNSATPTNANYAFTSTGSALSLNGSTSVTFRINATNNIALTSNALTFMDGVNMVLGTTTGTKFGTATSQKIGFFNATPVVQPGATTDLITAQVNLGLRASGTAVPITTSGAISFNSSTNTTLTNNNLAIATAGKGLVIKGGANSRIGTATLVAGTVTISNTTITANTRIFVTVQSLGTVTTMKAVGVTAKVNGTSFTITSADNTDTSVVAWQLIEEN